MSKNDKGMDSGTEVEGWLPLKEGTGWDGPGCFERRMKGRTINASMSPLKQLGPRVPGNS